MINSHDDQKVAEHLMRVIARTLVELNTLYPMQSPHSAEAVLLTAGILKLIDQAGPERAAQTVRSLAKEIETGGFDIYTNWHRATMQ